MFVFVINPPKIDYMQELPSPLQTYMIDYFNSGSTEPLSNNAYNLLNYYAKNFGFYSADELLTYMYQFASQVTTP